MSIALADNLYWKRKGGMVLGGYKLSWFETPGDRNCGLHALAPHSNPQDIRNQLKAYLTLEILYQGSNKQKLNLVIYIIITNLLIKFLHIEPCVVEHKNLVGK